jgi:hypothetical protein
MDKTLGYDKQLYSIPSHKGHKKTEVLNYATVQLSNYIYLEVL